MASTPALQLEHVSKQFGFTRAVNDLSFRVEEGAICGFLGPNGAGKTTSLRMILDIIKPDTGTVRVFGEDKLSKVRDRIGFLPEERGLYRKMTAISIIAFYGRLKGLSGADARRRARDLLEEYGLGAARDKKIKDLSKGMAQKVQILASLVHRPGFLILDEPFSGLDPVNQQLLERLIADTRAQGTTIMFSTHVMEHAERLCDNIILLSRGTKVFDGRVTEALDLLPRFSELVLPEGADPTTLSLAHVLFERIGDDEEGVRWRAHFTEPATSQTVLTGLVEARMPVRSFETVRPHLHDAFVMLVNHDSEGANQTGQPSDKPKKETV